MTHPSPRVADPSQAAIEITKRWAEQSKRKDLGGKLTALENKYDRQFKVVLTRFLV
jgi:hypothetical protein